jgi:hypothetical protein
MLETAGTSDAMGGGQIAPLQRAVFHAIGMRRTDLADAHTPHAVSQRQFALGLTSGATVDK